MNRLTVSTLSDSQCSGFGDLQLRHDDCHRGPLRIRRLPGGEDYGMRCRCGWSHHAPLAGRLVECVDLTAIDEQARSVASDGAKAAAFEILAEVGA